MKIKISFEVDTAQKEPVTEFSVVCNDAAFSSMTNEDIKILTVINYDMQAAFKSISDAVQHKSSLQVEGCHVEKKEG